MWNNLIKEMKKILGIHIKFAFKVIFTVIYLSLKLINRYNIWNNLIKNINKIQEISYFFWNNCL